MAMPGSAKAKDSPQYICDWLNFWTTRLPAGVLRSLLESAVDLATPDATLAQVEAAGVKALGKAYPIVQAPDGRLSVLGLLNGLARTGDVVFVMTFDPADAGKPPVYSYRTTAAYAGRARAAQAVARAAHMAPTPDAVAGMGMVHPAASDEEVRALARRTADAMAAHAHAEGAPAPAAALARDYERGLLRHRDQLLRQQMPIHGGNHGPALVDAPEGVGPADPAGGP
jgi:hypothetical protein